MSPLFLCHDTRGNRGQLIAQIWLTIPAMGYMGQFQGTDHAFKVVLGRDRQDDEMRMFGGGRWDQAVPCSLHDSVGGLASTMASRRQVGSDKNVNSIDLLHDLRLRRESNPHLGELESRAFPVKLRSRELVAFYPSLKSDVKTEFQMTSNQTQKAALRISPRARLFRLDRRHVSLRGDRAGDRPGRSVKP